MSEVMVKDITIVLADDHQVVRSGLRLLLEAEDGFRVVAEAGDVPTTERRVAAYRPRVLLHGHSHLGYGATARVSALAGTRIIDVYGHYLLEW